MFLVNVGVSYFPPKKCFPHVFWFYHFISHLPSWCKLFSDTLSCKSYYSQIKVFFRGCYIIRYTLILIFCFSIKGGVSLIMRSANDQIQGIQKTGVITNTDSFFFKETMHFWFQGTSDSEAVQLVCLVLMYHSKEAKTMNKGFWTKYNYLLHRYITAYPLTKKSFEKKQTR